MQKQNYLYEIHKRNDHLEGLCTDDRTILKCAIGKTVRLLAWYTV